MVTNLIINYHIQKKCHSSRKKENQEKQRKNFRTINKYTKNIDRRKSVDGTYKDETLSD